MKGSVTVDEALKKGRIKLVYLPMLTIIGSIGLGFLLHEKNIGGTWIIAGCGVGGFLLAWFAWSYFVVDWKIWAYENVDNFNELQRKAINEKLIWSNGSWFEKTEIKNDEQKRKLKYLEKRFEEKDVYHDDITVPKETIVHHSKAVILFGFSISLFFLGSAVFFYITSDSTYLWIFMIVAGIYSFYSTFKKYIDKSPQIIINSDGIKLKNQKLTSWSDIRNDRVFTERSGKHSSNYLAFNSEQVSIDGLDISMSKLEKLLHVYRVRYEKK